MRSVPVVPGDGRVACQHCYARILLTDQGGPAEAWIDPDAVTSDLILCCVPSGDMRRAVWHKPMPRIRSAR